MMGAVEDRLSSLRRSADSTFKEWVRASSQRFNAGALALLVWLYSLTGFAFRMTPPNDEAAFIYGAVPIGIGLGIWWWTRLQKEKELSGRHHQILEELRRVEEAHYDPSRH